MNLDLTRRLMPRACKAEAMNPHLEGTDHSLAESIVDSADTIVREAEQAQRPIEIDPFRSRLFELFVTADGAGYLKEDADVDLTADGLCRQLAERWGLADATRASVQRQEKLPPEHLGRMRLLWSLLRMWMEWQYAWQRWPEFHEG